MGIHFCAWTALLLTFELTLSANANAKHPGSSQGYSSRVVQYLPNDDYESVWGAGWYWVKDDGLGFYINGQITIEATSETDVSIFCVT